MLISRLLVYYTKELKSVTFNFIYILFCTYAIQSQAKKISFHLLIGLSACMKEINMNLKRVN